MMRRGYVDTGAGQVHLRSLGHGTELVLLLHQTASSSAMFEAFALELALTAAPALTDGPRRSLADRYRFVALDTPGFGQSFVPAGPYSLGDWAETVLEVTTALDAPRFHLLGHHTGAAIAIEVAARAPERVLSLAMIGALAMLPDERDRWEDSVRGMQLDDSGLHLATAWRQVGAIDADPSAFPPDLALRHREVVDKLSAGERWHEAYLAVFRADSADRLAATGCPAVLFSGVADVLHPYVGETLEARPGIRYHELLAGAYVLDQQPELVAAPYAGFLCSVGGERD